MKYILIFLISFAFGQTLTDEPIDLSTSKTNITGSGARLTIPENAKYFQTISVGDISDYVEECYNDSVHIGWNYYFENTIEYAIPISAILAYDSTRGNFIKSEPIYAKEETTPTLKGFVEWLNYED